MRIVHGILVHTTRYERKVSKYFNINSTFVKTVLFSIRPISTELTGGITYPNAERYTSLHDSAQYFRRGFRLQRRFNHISASATSPFLLLMILL